MSDARRIPLPRPGIGASKARMAEILRVDHAGEFAAVHIYRAQRAVFEGRKGREAVSADLTEMEGHEQVHLDRFEALLNERRVRPTAMTPVWKLAATALGAELAKFREEELAHHDHAVEHGSREAPGYRLLSAVIKAGCRTAIKISEKV